MFHSVLLFMTPVEVEKSLAKSYKLLNKGGKLYIFAVSPYAYDSFTPVYESLLKEKAKWPGFVLDMSPYNPKRGKEALFLLDKTILKQLLEKQSFMIQEIFEMSWNEEKNKWIRLDKGDFTGVIAVKK
jgi:hypothetical protein